MSDPFLGEIRLFAFPRTPDGWLACNGQVLQVSQFDALVTILGTTYGGDGTQTFNLPGLRGRVPLGQGQAQGGPTYKLGEAAGEDEHTLIQAEMPTHSHSLLASTADAASPVPGTAVHLATASTG